MAAPFDLRRFIERELSDCVSTIEGGGEILPRFVAINDAGELFVIATPWSGEDDKLAALAFLRGYFLLHGIVAYCQVSESWQVERAYDSIDQRAPEQCEDRTEHVHAFGVSHSEKVFASRQIIRDGGRVRVDPPRYLNGGSLGGRMTELLPPFGTAMPSPEMAAKLERIFKAGGGQRRARGRK